MKRPKPTKADLPAELTPAQEQAVELLTAGKGVGDVAATLGVHRSTLWDWGKMPAFQEAQAALRRERSAAVRDLLPQTAIQAVRVRTFSRTRRLLSGTASPLAGRSWPPSLSTEDTRSRRPGRSPRPGSPGRRSCARPPSGPPRWRAALYALSAYQARVPRPERGRKLASRKAFSKTSSGTAKIRRKHKPSVTRSSNS
jgi:hypothetical protein